MKWQGGPVLQKPPKDSLRTGGSNQVSTPPQCLAAKRDKNGSHHGSHSLYYLAGRGTNRHPPPSWEREVDAGGSPLQHGKLICCWAHESIDLLKSSSSSEFHTEREFVNCKHLANSEVICPKLQNPGLSIHADLLHQIRHH